MENLFSGEHPDKPESTQKTQKQQYVQESVFLDPEEDAREGRDTSAIPAPMDTDPELMAAVEAILFSMGDAVEISALAKALEKTERRISKVIDLLREKYDGPGSGLMICQFENSVQISTRPEQYGNLIRIARVPKKLTLSDSVIETLSIIAYKQPITKAEIEAIRGVSCEYAVNRLLDYDLIKELGRKADVPGRPIIFGTTQQFLRCFGVKELSELPSPNSMVTEEFREEAEKEIDSRLGI